MSKAQSTRYPAPALDKGLDVLEFMAQTIVPQSQSQIATGLRKSPHEIFRMVTRLRDRGYLVRDEISEKYELSLRLFEMSRTHSSLESLTRIVRPIMRNLSDGLGQSCHLSVLDEDHLLIVCQALSPLAISLSIAPGSAFEPLATTSGRLLLGVMPEKEQASALARQKLWKTAPTARRKVLRTVFRLAGRNRFLIYASELAPGVTDVAAFIGKPDGTVRAALTVSCIGHNPAAIKRESKKILNEVFAAVHDINLSIGVSE